MYKACNNVVILWKVDKITGEKEILNLFQSIKMAKLYRRRHFPNELEDWSTYYPIEKRRVLYRQEELEG